MSHPICGVIFSCKICHREFLSYNNLMLFFREFFHTSETPFNEWQEDCSKCTHKICCSVFDIIDEKDQWRHNTTVKEAGIHCTHLGTDGKCTIYDTRQDYPWFRACRFYSCHNIGPTLSKWLEKNDIPFNGDPRLGHILEFLQMHRHHMDITEHLERHTSIEALYNSTF